MNKHYFKKISFLLSVSLLSSMFCGCTREVAMPIIGNSNSNTKTDTSNENSSKKVSKEKVEEKNPSSNIIKETSSVTNESVTVESETTKDSDNENSKNAKDNEGLSVTSLDTDDEANNSKARIFNIEMPNNNNSSKENKIGYIYNILNSNNTYSIEFDEVKLFFGEEANNEYLADGHSDELDSGYYIKNSNEEIKKYTLVKDCVYELCEYEVDPLNSNSENLTSVDFETLKDYISKYQEFYPTRALLFDISLEDNIVTKISMHFTP